MGEMARHAPRARRMGRGSARRALSRLWPLFRATIIESDHRVDVGEWVGLKNVLGGGNSAGGKSSFLILASLPCGSWGVDRDTLARQAALLAYVGSKLYPTGERLLRSNSAGHLLLSRPVVLLGKARRRSCAWRGDSKNQWGCAFRTTTIAIGLNYIYGHIFDDIDKLINEHSYVNVGNPD